MDEIVIGQDVLVSVGIPMYNAEKFISYAINSVINQTYQNFELIITDDGSTDSSVKIVESFNDPRIILISDYQNYGISYRLNQQIDIARGKYFFRMDADDIMFPDRIQKQIIYLIKHPEIDALGSPAVIIDDENEILGIRTTSIPENHQGFFKSTPFIHPTVCAKTHWLKQYRYDGNLNGAEDFDLWSRSSQNSKFAILDSPILFYRDPRIFKLKTYLFRLKQQRQVFYRSKFLKNKVSLRNKLILTTFFKSGLAKFLNAIGKDNTYLSRRNNGIKNAKDYKNYELILRESLKKANKI